MKLSKFVKIVALAVAVTFLTAFFAMFPFGEIGENQNHGSDIPPSQSVISDFSEFASSSETVYLGAPEVSAKSALLCTSDGELLFEKQADIPLPMASITKIMTAVIALEKTNDLKREITVPREAVGVEGSSVYLKLGETVDMEMLLYSALLESANDASTAIAFAVSGSEKAFVDEMNKKASELSMDSTSFKNPHGLSVDGHYTTCRDYVKLMAYALQNTKFREIIATKKKVIPSSDGSLTRVLTNHNRLLNTYSGMLGGKTGFTKLSGRTLVTAAEKDGTTLICITINAPNDWNDHSKLFDFGFGAVKTEAFSPEKYPIEIKLAGGLTECAKAEFQPFSVTVPSDKEPEIKIIIPHMIFAPAEKGKVVGRVVCLTDGEVIKEVDIYLLHDCEPSTTPISKRGFIGKITGLFKK